MAEIVNQGQISSIVNKSSTVASILQYKHVSMTFKQDEYVIVLNLIYSSDFWFLTTY